LLAKSGLDFKYRFIVNDRIFISGHSGGTYKSTQKQAIEVVKNLVLHVAFDLPTGCCYYSASGFVR
ncbi:MAG: hypothetical protein ACJA0I_001997, partial [Gammaproteobacteria bacterium]